MFPAEPTFAVILQSLAQSGMLAALFRACVGGGVVVLLVWAMCRAFPRLPAKFRFALWWMACAKLIFGVFCAGVVPLFVPGALQSVVSAPVKSLVRPFLPVLPTVAPAKPFKPAIADPTTSAPSSVAKPDVEAAANAATAVANSLSLPVFGSAPAATASTETVAPALPAARKTEREADEAAAPRPATALTPARFLAAAYPALLLLYVLGFTWFVVRAIRAALVTRRIVRHSVPLSPTETRTHEIAETTAALLGMRPSAVPRLLESADAVSPFVTGWLRPVLVLPVGFAHHLTDAQRTLVFAHELAHIRRGDLWLCSIPHIAQTALWFFPLAHLACRETLQAAEEACDACALASCPHERGELGRLLLRLSLRAPKAVAPALGMAAPGFSRLKRRLHALQAAPPMSRPRQFGAFVMALFAGVAVLPWQIGGARPSLARESDAPNAPVSPNSSGHVPRYEIVDLGQAGETYSDACAISDNGLVVGTMGGESTGGRGIAFAYDSAAGQWREIGSAPYRRSIAVGVSASGIVAALGYNKRARPQGFVWNGSTNSDQAGTFLWPLPGYKYSRASGVNDRGQVVGSAHGLARGGVLPARAFVQNHGGALVDLGTLGGPYSHASAVSPSGLVVGKADTARPKRGADYQTHAFSVQTGETGATEKVRDLGTLPGGKNSRAWAVSGQNEIVGFSEAENKAATVQHAFLHNGTNGAMRDLGTLAGKSNSVAYGINAQGWIVGTSGSSAVLWTRTARKNPTLPARVAAPLDLNTCVPARSGWDLQTARGINAQGWIVGQGTVSGKQRAFLLKPI